MTFEVPPIHFFGRKKNNHVGNLEPLFCFVILCLAGNDFAGKRVVTDVIMCVGMCELVWERANVNLSASKVKNAKCLKEEIKTYSRIGECVRERECLKE